jgi:hypothetical protein
VARPLDSSRGKKKSKKSSKSSNSNRSKKGATNPTDSKSEKKRKYIDEIEKLKDRLVDLNKKEQDIIKKIVDDDRKVAAGRSFQSQPKQALNPKTEEYRRPVRAAKKSSEYNSV